MTRPRSNVHPESKDNHDTKPKPLPYSVIPPPHTSNDNFQDDDATPPGLTCWWESDSDDEETASTTTQSTSSKYTNQYIETNNGITTHTHPPPQTPQAVNHITCSQTPQESATEVRHDTLVPTQLLPATSHVTHIPIIGLHPVDEQPSPQENQYIGDSLQLPKQEGITRLYFQNLNGITLSTTGNWEETCSHLRDMEVDIALIAEHKLDTTQP